MLLLVQERAVCWCAWSRVQGSGFRVQVPGSRVQVPGSRVQGPGFRVQGSGFRVQGLNNLLLGHELAVSHHVKG